MGQKINIKLFKYYNSRLQLNSMCAHDVFPTCLQCIVNQFQRVHSIPKRIRVHLGRFLGVLMRVWSVLVFQKCGALVCEARRCVRSCEASRSPRGPGTIKKCSRCDKSVRSCTLAMYRSSVCQALWVFIVFGFAV